MKRRHLICLLGLAPLWAGAADLPALIERSKPSVVLVGTYSPTDSPRFGFHGTGFAVADGSIVITNAHVLPSPDVTEAEQRISIQVRAASGEWGLRMARIAALDRAHDLVALSFEGAPVPALRIAGPTLAKEGRAVLFMGFPIGGALGFSTVSHRGIISAITPISLPAANARSLDPRALRQLRAGSFDILQLDATAYPGNSGGPVLDQETGEVVGIINMVLTKAGKESALTNPSGISYAIPVAQIAPLVESAKAAR
ncbi:S1C family serine protease [Roseateles saccharophilus]|uniref:Trypsin-like peptidase n=1 Tax=Roseateles saccharophilus TaxID=304 RepID=A0A4R3UIC6_ROSSA|nr:serine protease [Roseateles saccharophilus]MDG0834918.1 serine protease [Roseateles saccharophilus]TCU88332.1 trypsin-like peptidase [Roseateles saccharophilus]